MPGDSSGFSLSLPLQSRCWTTLWGTLSMSLRYLFNCTDLYSLSLLFIWKNYLGCPMIIQICQRRSIGNWEFYNFHICEYVILTRQAPKKGQICSSSSWRLLQSDWMDKTFTHWSYNYIKQHWHSEERETTFRMAWKKMLVRHVEFSYAGKGLKGTPDKRNGLGKSMEREMSHVLRYGKVGGVSE